MTPKQNIIPKHIIEAYKIIEDAKKKKQIVCLYGGRAYGKTILHKLLTKDN